MTYFVKEKKSWNVRDVGQLNLPVAITTRLEYFFRG